MVCHIHPVWRILCFCFPAWWQSLWRLFQSQESFEKISAHSLGQHKKKFDEIRFFLFLQNKIYELGNKVFLSHPGTFFPKRWVDKDSFFLGYLNLQPVWSPISTGTCGPFNTPRKLVYNLPDWQLTLILFLIQSSVVWLPLPHVLLSYSSLFLFVIEISSSCTCRLSFSCLTSVYCTGTSISSDS